VSQWHVVPSTFPGEGSRCACIGANDCTEMKNSDSCKSEAECDKGELGAIFAAAKQRILQKQLGCGYDLESALGQKRMLVRGEQKVRFGSLANIEVSMNNVCLRPKADILQRGLTSAKCHKRT
jgi:hypothetical protein